ncbi:hypothetical protein CHARACLAT_030000 [Characodon lateralis]|uniref:Uncharacterized protein n=1 Tax=Characodon lateralis TaxID=208331 RepID=A0ABU7DVD5_9TELE|nr:hypothetical protein [Characodon lateralis]
MLTVKHGGGDLRISVWSGFTVSGGALQEVEVINQKYIISELMTPSREFKKIYILNLPCQKHPFPNVTYLQELRSKKKKKKTINKKPYKFKCLNATSPPAVWVSGDVTECEWLQHLQDILFGCT